MLGALDHREGLARDGHRDPEFLPELAHDRRGTALAGLDVPARDIPDVGESLAVRRSMAQQDRRALHENRAARDVLRAPSPSLARSRSAGDLVRLRVELAVPLAELHDRAVGVGERGRRQERLVLPDRLVFLDLLVDLLDERVGDGRRELLVVELAHDEVEVAPAWSRRRSASWSRC